MVQPLIIGVLIGVVLFLLSRALVKTKRQAKSMQLQSHEIQKHFKELEQRNKELQKVNQEKIQIISLVSHDLKGPFNRIFALTQLMSLSQENLTIEQKEFLAKIHQITADGLGMVRNLLDSRKLDDKGIELNVGGFDFTELVSSLVKNYSAVAQKKKIEIVFDSGGPITMEADKLYVGRVIENLLSNAVKFSQEEKKILIRLRDVENSIELSIKDEGPGISVEDQRKLFQRFQQLSAQPTGGESSSGLGLFIVKTIVDKIGGEIFCQSNLGEGACFTVRLPNKPSD